MKTHSAKNIRILAYDHILGNEASSHDVFLMFLMTVFIQQRLSAIRKTYSIVENDKLYSFATITYCHDSIQSISF